MCLSDRPLMILLLRAAVVGCCWLLPLLEPNTPFPHLLQIAVGWQPTQKVKVMSRQARIHNANLLRPGGGLSGSWLAKCPLYDDWRLWVLPLPGQTQNWGGGESRGLHKGHVMTPQCNNKHWMPFNLCCLLLVGCRQPDPDQPLCLHSPQENFIWNNP